MGDGLLMSEIMLSPNVDLLSSRNVEFLATVALLECVGTAMLFFVQLRTTLGSPYSPAIAFGLVGSTTTTAMVFVLPPAFFLKVQRAVPVCL